MAPSSLFLISLLLISTFFSSPTQAKCLPRQEELTAKYCANLPVVPDLDLSTYTGRWYQIYTTADAGRFSSNRCVTANYTAQPDGSIAVFNCQYPADVRRPTCVNGVATRRPGGLPANLGVSFRPGTPPGQYNVVAALGFKSYGYFAAAVFSCDVTEEGVRRGFFIIARTPYKPQFVLRIMKRKLRCLGIPLDDRFVRSRHPPKCKYFDGPKGYDIRDPVAFGRKERA